MKQGTVIVEAGKPLQFGDAVETDSPASGEQHGSNLIAVALKAYRAAASALLDGKYAYYAELAHCTYEARVTSGFCGAVMACSFVTTRRPRMDPKPGQQQRPRA